MDFSIKDSQGQLCPVDSLNYSDNESLSVSGRSCAQSFLHSTFSDVLQEEVVPGLAKAWPHMLFPGKITVNTSCCMRIMHLKGWGEKCETNPSRHRPPDIGGRPRHMATLKTQGLDHPHKQ